MSEWMKRLIEKNSDKMQERYHEWIQRMLREERENMLSEDSEKNSK